MKTETKSQLRNNPMVKNIAATPPQRGALKHKAAAFYLSVSEPTLFRLCKRGLIKPNRANRHKLYDVRELDRFLRS